MAVNQQHLFDGEGRTARSPHAEPISDGDVASFEERFLEDVEVRPARRPTWRRQYLAGVAAADTLAFVASVVAATFVRFGSTATSLDVLDRHVPYLLVVVLMAPAWWIGLGTAGVYERQIQGRGNEEYRRIVNGAIRCVALLALVDFVGHLRLARSLVVVGVPLAVLISVAARFAAHRVLDACRRRGTCLQQALLVAAPASVTQLTRDWSRRRETGIRVAAVYAGGEPGWVRVGERMVEVIGGERDRLVRRVGQGGIDAVVVVDGDLLGDNGLRRLCWDLEGAGVDVIVTPRVNDVAGPRLRVLPVGGLPLLHVTAPRFGGVTRVVKSWVERALAAAALLALSPVFAAVALAIRVDSRGPVFFRQVRVGLRGRQFTMWKFRSMTVDAETRLADLVELNECAGVLFKIRRDPRITRVGRWLRRFSLDELPQLWNVVTGDMSIVGPRPALPSEVARYGDDVLRRLLVKPGLTGLWQVSGRSQLTWEDSVLFDLHYVDNWSVGLDLVIVARTLGAVLRGEGAY